MLRRPFQIHGSIFNNYFVNIFKNYFENIFYNSGTTPPPVVGLNYTAISTGFPNIILSKQGSIGPDANALMSGTGQPLV